MVLQVGMRLQKFLRTCATEDVASLCLCSMDHGLPTSLAIAWQ